MATVFMLSIKLPCLADILSSRGSVVTCDSIEISLSAGSAILEVCTTAARMLLGSHVCKCSVHDASMEIAWHHILLIPTASPELSSPVPHLPWDQARHCHICIGTRPGLARLELALEPAGVY